MLVMADHTRLSRRSSRRPSSDARPCIAASQPEPAPGAPYTCSKCGYCSHLPEPDWADLATPVWNPKEKSPEDFWAQCPDEGPLVATLVHPLRSDMRIRQDYLASGQRTRACIVWALLNRSREGGFRTGPVIPRYKVSREIYRRSYLQSHGADPELDLERAFDAINREDRFIVGEPIGISRVGQAFILSLRRYIPYDDWARRISRELGIHQLSKEWKSVEAIAAVLDPRLRGDPPMNAATLLVPFDLREPLEEQWARRRKELLDIRGYVSSFTEKAIARSRAKTVWRDVYIFLSVNTAHRTVAEVGRLAFPREKAQARTKKVWLIVQRVARVVADGGLALPGGGGL